MEFLTRLAVFLSFLVMANIAYAAGNSVYIDQIGDTSTISITQTGNSNAIGGANTRAVINGNSNLITIDQIGNSNTLSMQVEGDGNEVTQTITGDVNSLSLLCATCSMVTITDTIQGSGNEISRIIDSSSGTSTVDIQSDNNTVSIQNDSSAIAGASSNVSISGGNGNSVTLNQTGAAGVNGHNAILSIIGASNTAVIEQGGNVDSYVDATISGSGNSLNINSNYQ